MHAKGIRSPILLTVCALWIGCLPMWIGFKLALGTAFIGTHALFRKSHFSILPTGFMIMLGICMHEYSDWIRPKPHLPLTGLWSCQSQGIQKEGRGFSLLCQCNAYRKPFRVEWPHASPPPFETPFLGSMMPFTHLPPGVIQWKHRRSIFGSLHPTWNQQVSREPDAVQNHQTHAWPDPPVTAKSELWNDLSRVFSPSVSGLLFALSTGDKQYVVPKTRAALTHAGLAHLLAVSGYHVGLVATIPLFLLRSRRRVFRFWDSFRWLAYGTLLHSVNGRFLPFALGLWSLFSLLFNWLTGTFRPFKYWRYRLGFCSSFDRASLENSVLN